MAQPFEAAELGYDPPLDAGVRRHAMDDRRQVSARWLAATILTGLSGGGLMAAAVIGVRDHERSAERRPQILSQRQTPAQGDRPLVTARKGDKLVRSIDLTSAKQAFKTPTTIRAGDREVIKVKGFARISAPLMLVGGTYAEEIPAFNPLKLLTDSGSDKGFEAAPAQSPDDPEAEVSLLSHDLAGFSAAFANGSLSDQEVKAQVLETAAQPRRSVPAMPAQMLLARTMQAPALAGASGLAGYAPVNSAFSRLDVRMVEENVTIVPKIEAAAAQEATEERVLTAARGQTVEQIVRANGASPQQARAISAALKDKTLNDGQRVRMLFTIMQPGAPRQLVRVTIYGDEQIEGIAALDDVRGAFVAVAPPQPDQPSSSDDDDDETETKTNLALYNSLYETLLKNDVPRAVVNDVVRVLSNDSDTDFQRSVGTGDAIDLFYSDDDDEAREVLFVSLTAAGEVKRYYRFTNPDDNSVDYFDESGRSAKKFLLRKPVMGGELRSGFGMRRHPILGYSKMHTGIDYAGPAGLPIVAAGNGVVIKAGWDSGYGRRVEIQHANGYLSTYSHMSAFGRSIQPGTRVRQGAIVGYVGSSGLSTGSHLHYEVIVNERYVDPLRIRIPRGRELEGRMLAEFRREKERIDGLRQKSPAATRVGALTTTR